MVDKSGQKDTSAPINRKRLRKKFPMHTRGSKYLINR